MAINTNSPEKDLSPGTDPGQDEFDQLIEKNFSPGDERMMEERAQKGAAVNTEPRDSSPGLRSLADSESSFGPDTVPKHENQVGVGYRANSDSPRGRFAFASYNNRAYKRLVGGGIIGGIIGIVIFFASFLSGPFEFIHIAQLLEHWHFSNQQDAQDDRFTKAIRLYRYAGMGEVEHTRLGYIGNKIANGYEAQLNKSGLKSSYSDLFGYHDGYVIDTENAASPYHGLEGEALQDEVEKVTGIRPVKGADIYGSSADIADDWVIPVKNLSYTGRLKLNFSLLQEAGANKVSAAVGTRFLCERAGCTSLLHPLSKAIGNGGNAIEEWWKNRNSETQNGEEVAKQPAEDDSKDKTGGELESDINADESSPKSAGDISTSLAKGGLAATGILCVAKGVASQAQSLKAGQVQVLIRMAVEATAVGNQFESGQDNNLAQAKQYSTLLNGPSSAGKTTDWNDAESVQANQGNANTGVPADNAVKDVTNDTTPFDFLSQDGIGTALGAVCSAPGQFIQVLVGSVGDVISGAIIGQILAHTGFLTDLAQWLAGTPINVDAVGAEYGSEIDYGAALASNAQAVLSGGSAMSTTQANALQTGENQIDNQEFGQESIADRLFNPYDERSAISKVIDQIRPSPSQNFASLGSAFLNFGHTLARLPSLLIGSAHATNSATFNYGFPTYGFSEQDLDNSMVANPYENACYVVGCASENTASGQSQPIVGFLTGTSDGGPADATGQTYISRADKCFGVTIAPTTLQTSDGSQNQWDVTSDGKQMPNPYDDKYSGSNCGDTSDPNWLRLRFFILDTETMNAMGCESGSDTDPSTAQACTDIGFGSDAAATTASTNSSSTPLLPVCQLTSDEIHFAGYKTQAFGDCGQYESANLDYEYTATIKQGSASCSYSGSGDIFTFPSFKGTASITYTLKDTNDDGTSNTASASKSMTFTTGGAIGC